MTAARAQTKWTRITDHPMSSALKLTLECRYLSNEVILAREADSECVVAYEGEALSQFWPWAAELQGSGWQVQTVYIGPTFRCSVTGLPSS